MKKITPVDEWQDAVIKHLKLLEDNEKREFAHKLIFDIAFETGISGYEMMGLLEGVKLNLSEHLNNIAKEGCDGDCKNCNRNPDK
jgi:hypothetical protein